MSKSMWFAWAIVVLFLAVIARLAFLGTQPESECSRFFARDAACLSLEEAGR